jgi:hypothetical protein
MILSVKRVAGSTDFTVLPMPTTPLAIAPGAQIDFTVAFNPTATGLPEFATIQIISNDPVRPVLDLRAEGTEKLPRSCDLVITSDDPGDPVKTLEVMATTVWEQRCAKCCDDCRKGCCEKQHCDPCRCHKCAGECDDADHDDDGD